MSKQLAEVVTFICLEEYNDWEGETWYHYFLNEPGVFDILNPIEESEDNDVIGLEVVNVTLG